MRKAIRGAIGEDGGGGVHARKMMERSKSDDDAPLLEARTAMLLRQPVGRAKGQRAVRAGPDQSDGRVRTPDSG